MKLVNLASAKSAERGYYYYINGNVLISNKVDDNNFIGDVLGSGDKGYFVSINLQKPKLSTCDCNLAAGKQIICKHKVALYFKSFPNDAEKYHNMVIEAQQEFYNQKDNEHVKVEKYINTLKKNEVKNLLLKLLSHGPDWQWDNFIRDNLEE